MQSDTAATGPGGLTRYQWLVLAATFMGWGFDVFDALLFNFVAPNCIATLQQLPFGSPEARQATVYWTGVLSALLLVGWACGGVLFGWIADRYGRRRALLLTISVYAIGTTLCAFATDMTQLVVFRAVTSLGIGGEWAVGAALLAETMPENRRVEAGTVLAIASPLGIMLASVVNYQIAGVWFADDPAMSWRYVFLCGLAPVGLALFVRMFVRESAHWQRTRSTSSAPAVRELFAPHIRPLTVAAIITSVSGLLTWWAINAFIPVLGGQLAGEHALTLGIDPQATRLVVESWKSQASNAFNIGGLLGAFAAIPLAQRLGRRPMYIGYFVWSALSIFVTFGLDLSPQLRLRMLFLVGLGVFGIFSTYVFYLPELFPTRLRALGAGLSFNIGRLIAAVGPFVVGTMAARSGGSSAVIMQALVWVGLFPLLAALSARWIIVETRGRQLPE